MRILVTGGGGVVGRAVRKYCDDNGDQVVYYDHQSLDVSDSDRVIEIVKADRPEVVINCAAFTNVDRCEEEQKRALAANARGPQYLARACRETNALLVTISTDFVFDGEKEGFYTQRDQPNPQGVYARSKLKGERRAQWLHARTIVVRTGYVFGTGGTNFLSTVIENARNDEPLKAISDVYGTPTYAPDLAKRLRELAQRDIPGIFHVVNDGPGVSYEEFARVALDISGFAETKLAAVTMASLNRKAPRPRNSRLKCLLSEAVGLAPLPLWSDALRAFAELEARREVAAKT